MFLQKVFFSFLFATSCFLWGGPAIAKKAVVKEEKPFVIVVPSFNNDAYFKKNLDSIFSQAYQNYQVIYIDDCSTDNTYQNVKRYVKARGKEDKVTLIRNQKNLGALHNIYKAIHTCSNEKIIAVVDGDDWLAHTSVLKDLNSYYANEHVWMTYGQHSRSPKNLSRPLPSMLLKEGKIRLNRRNYPYLRTFYAGLFKRIFLSHLTKEGSFFPTLSTFAIMLPMLEMAREHAYFVPKELYIKNPITAHRKIPSKEKIQLDQYIHSLPTYLKINLHPKTTALNVAKKAVVKEEKPFVIIVPSFNNDAYFKKNLDSIFSQAYQNYQVIYIDDCSTDNTYQNVKHYVKARGKEDKVTLIRNQKNLGALHNIYKAIHTCSNEKIIAIVDGDDWLAHNSVLKDLNSYYTNEDVWLTYGQYRQIPKNHVGLSEPVTKSFLKKGAVRVNNCLYSHLRTFYAGLFKKIDLSHLTKKGKFFSATYDLAIMFPMLEMAREHAYFVPDVLYIYNYENPINDAKIRLKEQTNLEKYIRSLPVYPKLPVHPKTDPKPFKNA